MEIKEILQGVVNAAESWACRADADWSVQKCYYLQLSRGRGGEVNGKVFLDGSELKVVEKEKYLRMTLS